MKYDIDDIIMKLEYCMKSSVKAPCSMCPIKDDHHCSGTLMTASLFLLKELRQYMPPEPEPEPAPKKRARKKKEETK